MPAVVIGVPERRIAGGQGRGEKAKEGVELVLGVPRHHRVGDDPAACREQPQRPQSLPAQGRDRAQQGAPTLAPRRRAERQIRGFEHARPFQQVPKGRRRDALLDLSIWHFPVRMLADPAHRLNCQIAFAPHSSVNSPSWSCWPVKKVGPGAVGSKSCSHVQNAGCRAWRSANCAVLHLDFAFRTVRLSSVVVQGGRHGRKRLQDHRDRRHQHHSWEKAAAAAVERASTTLRDLRVAEVCEQDIVIADGKVEAYRVRLKVSFKFED